MPDNINCVGRQQIIIIRDHYQRSLSRSNASVQRRMLSTIFLPDISDRETITIFHLKRGHHFLGIVCGTIIDNNPFKIPARLGTQRLVETREQRSPVIGRREDSQ